MTGDSDDWKAAVAHLTREAGFLRFYHALEPYQLAFLRDRSLTRVVLKSRQIGFSWIFAVESLAHALLTDRATTLFLSLNHREACEKVRYVEMLHDALPRLLRGKLTSSSREALEWSNGSRILSFPCRAPRGFAGANVYLDELAFYPDDREVYLGTLPVLSRGGRLTLASTPFGCRGVFHEQVEKQFTAETQRRGKTPERTPDGFHRVPWWRCSWMVNDEGKSERSKGGSLRLCVSAVKDLPTEERVEWYGSERLKAIYAAMDRDSFQQEYECRFLEEVSGWIGLSELMPCVREDLEVAGEPAEVPASGAPLYAGFDVGRSVHPSELVVIEREPGGRGAVRLMKTLRRTAFAEQRALLEELLQSPRLRRLNIDATGMGAPLAEDLARAHPQRVEPVTFTSALKERLAVGIKLALNRRLLDLPADRELLTQIRSIQRTFGGGGRMQFEASPTSGGGGSETHGDRFWALALAWHASETAQSGQTSARRVGGG
ncbi:MAG: terminase family protein [Armatimonadetes bacterium]|nr:terminase family protein [Armatimonadota bacterium]